MVGLVLVSHSQTLAEGLLELIRQMAPDASIALAAGTENPDEPIGTDPMRVYSAIESVYSDDGVLILMDLGSAIMSAEAAIEFLELEQQAHIYLCEAPLVEGALAAAVAAAGGAPLTRVIAEARAALPGKLAQLEPVLRIKPTTTPPHTTPPLPVDIDGNAELTVTVPNRLGLHARPAARLVELVNRFNASVILTKGARAVDAGSITQVITLGVRHGDTIRFAAGGPESNAIIAAIQALADANFGDVDRAPAIAPTPAPTTVVVEPALDPAAAAQFKGIAASPGIAIGPAHVHRPHLPEVQHRRVTDVAGEQAALTEALLAAAQELEVLERTLTARGRADEAGILAAQRLMLMDQALAEQTRDQIRAEECNADWAWQQTIDALLADYAALDDPYLRGRGQDVRDAGNRVLIHLLGATTDHAESPTAQLTRAEPGILVTTELRPSDTANLDRATVLGIITATGGATDHVAILARGLGIPAVTGLPEAVNQIIDGQTIALDGRTGQVWLALSAERLTRLEEQRQQWIAQSRLAHVAAQEPAVTRDGHQLEIAANIGSATEVDAALTAGAEGVGLFRTEFLFMGRESAPDEETQLQAYRAAAIALGDRPLLIRTLDVGGDKPLPYLGIPAEENPFLGWRGIRYCLDNPVLFRTQLRAILRAGYGHRLQVMFPMVSTVAEVQQARTFLAEEQQVLVQAGIDCAATLAVGIMVETPAAVLNAQRLAAVVDFFSIGTNDLTQYLMAADRGNARVAGLIDALQPPVIAAIAQVAAAAHAAGIWVGICGELAGDPLATPLLVGLGINELSMSAPAIGGVKALIRTIEHGAAVELAHHLLTLPDAKAVRSALQKFADRGLYTAVEMGTLSE